MNPEAVEWLESVSEKDHSTMFTPSLPCVGARTVDESFFSLKPDHEACMACGYAQATGQLTVIS